MNTRQIVGLLLVALTVAVAMQNTQQVVLRAVVWHAAVPQFGALLTAASIGMIIGAIMTKNRRRSGKAS